MTETRYEQELAQLDATYGRALRADICGVKTAIAGTCEFSIIGVGSGGSFTVASLLCNLHETYTGRVSRPSTPLEIICNPTLASTSPVFLISAEGKNPDIVEALQRARMHSARPVHILTNRQESPLLESASHLTAINTHVFELADKDGYLATNSLLFDATVVARAYGELDRQDETLPSSLTDLRLGDRTIADWVAEIDSFVDAAMACGAVIVTFSPLLRPVAADLESKLAESALLHCQLADLRSFSHGRHLWLAERPSDCAIIALTDPLLSTLWSSTLELIPPGTPTLTMPFEGAEPRDQIAGLVAQMQLVSSLARRSGRDLGRPEVPQFGRDLHYLDISTLIPAPSISPEHGEQSKYEILGAQWPSIGRRGSMRRSLEAFRVSLEERAFRAVVFDYDGTLCGSHPKDKPPPAAVIGHLKQLLDEGVLVAIASGRGGSIQEQLRASLPEAYWPNIHVGLYNAGYIADLATTPATQPSTSEFLNHVTRIVQRLKDLGVPIEVIRTTHPYQVSVRFREGIKTDSSWFVIADALRQAGLDLSGIVRSKHSIDILSPATNKALLVAHVIQRFGVDPHDLLTIGDYGAWPGNDYSLLEHRFSLSVDIPSRRLDRGWKLAPKHKRDVDATLWYLNRADFIGDGRFKLRLSATEGQGEF